MDARLTRSAVATVLLLAWAPLALAQTEGAAELERLAGLVHAVHRAELAVPDTAFAEGWRAHLRDPLSRLEALVQNRSSATLQTMARSDDPKQRELAAYAASRTAIQADLDAVKEFWFDPDRGLRLAAKLHMSAPDFESTWHPVADFQDLELDRAQARVIERLDRFEVKWGPGAPKLNVIEMFVNLGLQGQRGFRPTADGPSPNEIVLAYSTSYATVKDDEARAVSVLETGWRRYHMSWRAGRDEGLASLLRPRYHAIGAAFSGPGDGALRNPLRGVRDRETRVGAFLSWGDLKVAALFGPEHRFLISRQFQLVPNLF